MLNKIKAMQEAGYREKYAMQHGRPVKCNDYKPHECYEFVYSSADPYQDANGATWDETIKKWIG